MCLSRHPAGKGTPIFLPVMPGQRLLFLICLIGAAALLWLAPAAAYADKATELGEANYSIGIGGAGGTTKITCYTLPGGATKWRYLLQANALDPLNPPQDGNPTDGANDYESGSDIPIKEDRHLILYATDYAGGIKAYADIYVEDKYIRAYDLKLTENYSAPIPGGAAGTTRITSLISPNGAATKWYIKVQSSAFPIPSLGDKVDESNFKDYNEYKKDVNDNYPDIPVQAGQRLMLLATDDDGKIMAFVDLPISAGQISKMVASLGGTIVTTETGEKAIRGGGKTLTITLSGNSWHDNLATEKSKRDLLFDSLVASGTEKAEWDKVITALTANPDITVVTDPVKATSTVTIKFPVVAEYNITSDQMVKVNIPPPLLSYTATVKPAPETFTIVADRTAFITGTIAPSTSSVTEADIRAGGKTITVTLVNDTWVTDIAADRAKRDALFDKLTATNDPAGPLVGWNTGVKGALKTSATITRVSPTKITITMPKVPTYNIDGEQKIELKEIPGTDPATCCLTSGDDLTIPDDPVSEVPSFTIDKVTPSATISGTAVTALTTEANIVAGGKTIIINLTGDTWEDDIVSTKTKREALVNCLMADDDPNNKWNSVKTEINKAIDDGNPNIIVRTSDSVVTITLPAVTGYEISDEQTITITLVADKNFTVENKAITVVPSFTIKPVKATAAGTVFTTATTREDIVRGGKTIIITLNNSTWAPDVATNLDKVKLLADGITGDVEWQKVMTALKASTGKIKVSGAALTITLPPVPDYFIQADQTVTIEINKELLKLPTADKLKAPPTFKIYTAALPPATGTVSFDPDLSVTDIKSGNAAITITLNNDTWVGDIVSNRNNLTKLIDGFTAASDNGQWELIKNAVKTNPVSVLSKEADNIITISLPAVSNYNIAADQAVSVKIPKALLNLTKSDLAATPSIIIKAEVKGDLDSMLQDGSLDTLLAERSPNDIFVNVPKKYICKIEMSNNDLGTTNLTSLSVQAEEEVNAVQATAGGVPHSSASYNVVGGKRVFSVAFSGLEKDTDVTVEAFSDTEYATRLGKGVVVKVAPGNTVPYPPKGSSAKSLAGAYSLQKLISDSKLFGSILLQYGLDELTVTASN